MLGKTGGLCLSLSFRRKIPHNQFHPFSPVPRKIIGRILFALLALALLFEIGCWCFYRFPAEPLKVLSLENDIPGFKKNVKVYFGDDQVRYLDWADGDKPEGSTRILFVGGIATLGMLQQAEDTWWGQLHVMLRQKGLKVQSAARGFDRSTAGDMAAFMAPIVDRLQPDVIILNAGFDDVIIHPADYTYNKEASRKTPRVAEVSALRTFLLKVSQIARFKRYLSRQGEANQMQNQLGRRDVYKRYFEDLKKEREKFSRTEDLLRAAGLNDPLPEYIDGLTAWRDLAARAKAKLILTGEASLHNDPMSFTEESNLVAYIALKKPDAEGRAPAARPDPRWVKREMQRFALKAETFATENKIPWLDLNGRVTPNLDNFFTDVLLTDAGAIEAAKALLPVVEPVIAGK